MPVSLESAKNAMSTTSIQTKDRFTSLIVVSLLLGLALGLFVGEHAAPLKLLGDAYVGLLQMTVLPYILFSLISNIGKLERQQAGFLARAGILVLLVLWGIAGLIVLAMALALPSIPSGSFFSTSLLAAPPEIDFQQLFIPANLFRALSANAVPAVVVFCLLFGTALMGFDDKKSLLEQLDLITRVLQKVNAMVVKLTPIGVFAITASAAGTLSLQEFGRLQAYLITFTLGVGLLVLWIYPLIIHTCTPVRWHKVVSASRDALLTAFVLGSVFAVIPILIRSVESMTEDFGDKEQHLPQLMLPLAYPFPDAGRILTLLFVPFAAWFYGSPLDLEDFGLLFTVGPVVLFGKVVTAVPYLLDLFEIPSDIFQLFLASGVLMGRLADTAGAMYLITFTVLTTAIMSGNFHIPWKRLGRNMALLVGVLVVLSIGLNQLLLSSYKDSFNKSQAVLEMQAMKQNVSITVMDKGEPNPVPLAPGELHGDRINERGVLRVGFTPDNLPYTFFNAQGQLVGLDIDLMQALALDLEVSLEFVPYEIANLAQALEDDHFDIAVSGITATAERSRKVLFSDPYLLVSMAMVIPDHRKRELSSESKLKHAGPLRIGARAGSYFIQRAQERYPNLEVVPLESEREFFIGEHNNLDGLLTSAEGGSAWTLIYPNFTTISPDNSTESAPLVFAIPHEMDMEEYLEIWITLKKMDGSIDKQFDYWILGKTPSDTAPRWSIMRDVLHWEE